ncbi:hypothetical protein V501_05522 [Pseudogymnoascus sp. VKM F-4519 (FW-2642)]|nr:hypothetical protein V501_05522 [Pseudogymnoascus sp. VKM F-4519 (FW-2642)]
MQASTTGTGKKERRGYTAASCAAFPPIHAGVVTARGIPASINSKGCKVGVVWCAVLCLGRLSSPSLSRLLAHSTHSELSDLATYSSFVESTVQYNMEPDAPSQAQTFNCAASQQQPAAASTSSSSARGAHARTHARRHRTQAAASQGPSRRHAHSPYNLALKSLKRRQHLTPAVLPADHPDLPDQNGARERCDPRAFMRLSYTVVVSPTRRLRAKGQRLIRPSPPVRHLRHRHHLPPTAIPVGYQRTAGSSMLHIASNGEVIALARPSQDKRCEAR